MPDGLRDVSLDPALVLSLLVGAFHACIYLVLRGRLGLRIIAILVAATVGAFVGQALGGRVGDILMLGDFGLLWASTFAWLGIGIVIVGVGLRDGDRGDTARGGEVRPRHRDG